MYLKDVNEILLCKEGEKDIMMEPKMANRHGLIAGATGTGKTVTLKVMAESFSEMGVPVFLADIKGDVSGLAQAGVMSDGFQKRLDKLGVKDFKLDAYPVRFFDVYGKHGHPVRTTISEIGPELLARLLELNDTQAGVLLIIFRIADDSGLLLLDLKDLRSMAQYVGDHAADYKTKYGNIAAQSIGAIQRALLKLEDQGGDIFFGEPALDIKDWLTTAPDGRGMINILHCVELFQQPLLYSTFLLWMLSELYNLLPEAGDMDKPKIVFFFDEAHLIFKDAPKSLLDKVEQIVRLIRSKGVGIYFITQSPTDVPDNVLSQLGNKVQHALRAYSPKDQKNLKAAAQAFRQEEGFNAEKVLPELGTGEVIVSMLSDEGVPQMACRAFVMPPRSFMGAVDENLRNQLIATSPLFNKYNTPIDRESAYEVLLAKANQGAAQPQQAAGQAPQQQMPQQQMPQQMPQDSYQQPQGAGGMGDLLGSIAGTILGGAMQGGTSTGRAPARGGRQQKTVVDQVLNKTMNRVETQICNSIVRSIFGCLKK